MTLEELWELFPIYLEEHRPYWADWFQEEVDRISTFLSLHDKRISHIGSTAIAGIYAKPIIDILLEIPSSISLESIKEILTANGYICMSQDEKQISFNRGYTKHGFAEKVFHLHLRYQGDNNELYFRDYMQLHPDAAKEYEELKLSLWKQYPHNRDAYTNAKSEIVIKYTELAIKEFASKY